MLCETQRVLIVGNKESICNFISELTSQGYQCTITSSGDDALTKMATQEFDVILLGTRLARISGLAVPRKIRLNHRNDAVIIMTNANAVDIAIKVLKLEVSDKVIKAAGRDDTNSHDNKCEIAEAWKYLREESDYEGLPHAQPEENDIRTMEDYFQEMNAIAHGVEVRNDLSIGWSNLIIQESIDIARRIEIPNKVVREWIARREAICSERNKRIERTLRKLKQSKIAQLILNLVNPDLYPSGSYVSKN